MAMRRGQFKINVGRQALWAAVLMAAAVLGSPQPVGAAPPTPSCTVTQAGTVDFGVLSPDINIVVTATTTPTIFVCRPIAGGGSLPYSITYDRGIRNNNTVADQGGAGPHTIAYQHSIMSPLTGAALNNIPVILDHSGTVANYQDAFCSDTINSCPYADTIVITIQY